MAWNDLIYESEALYDYNNNNAKKSKNISFRLNTKRKAFSIQS